MTRPPPRSRNSPPPSPAATPVKARLLGSDFSFSTAPGLFSADAVDDGTLLLLEHLPAGAPASVLDVGCGYGALGLPVAAAFPRASCTLLDRDVRAVAACADNARAHHLSNVTAVPGLGCRDLKENERFHWVLCNVPARIGPAGVGHLLSQGARHLASAGQLRAVVIHDLVPVVNALGRERGWDLRHVAQGARHAVVALPPGDYPHEDALLPYARDRVTLPLEDERLEFARPQDIGQDPEHLAQGLPLLLDMLPRRKLERGALVVRCGYGAVHVALGRHGTRVVSVDRDLLCSAFVHENARAHGTAVTTLDAWKVEDAVPHAPFDLLVLDHTATGAGRPPLEEIHAMAPLLAPDAEVLVLGRTRSLQALRAPGVMLAQRGPYAAWRIPARVLVPRQRRR